MKLCNRDPNFGLVVSDGTRVSCPPGGYIEVGETQGQALLKANPVMMVYGTKPKAEPKEEAAPVDPLSLLDPPAPKRGRGRPKAVPSLVLEPEEETKEEPVETGEVDPLAALDEGTEE